MSRRQCKWTELSQKTYNSESAAHPIKLVYAGSSSCPTEIPRSAERLIQVAKHECNQLYTIQNRSARRRAITSALLEIRQYAPIFDVFTQGAPSAVSICWGTIRVILEVREFLIASVQNLGFTVRLP